MKAILRIFRIPRKVLFIIGGVGLLGGVVGAAACVYLNQEIFFGPSEETLNGLACTPVKTFNIKQDDRYWIRTFIKTVPTDGMTRVKTALRVAKAINDEKHPDLVQVVVLDEKGPEQRAEMRGRAVGADVVYIAHPEKIPDYNARGGFTAKYVDGSANADGDFYGDKIVVSTAEIDKITSLFDKVEGCVDPEEEAKKASGGGHGAAPAAKQGGGQAPGGHGESAPEGEGDGNSGHGGGEDETPMASAEEPSFFSKMLGMVGLGSGNTEANGHGNGGAPHLNAELKDAPVSDHTAEDGSTGHPPVVSEPVISEETEKNQSHDVAQDVGPGANNIIDPETVTGAAGIGEGPGGPDEKSTEVHQAEEERASENHSGY